MPNLNKKKTTKLKINNSNSQTLEPKIPEIIFFSSFVQQNKPIKFGGCVMSARTGFPWLVLNCEN
jgi:hypothetical protein